MLAVGSLLASACGGSDKPSPSKLVSTRNTGGSGAQGAGGSSTGGTSSGGTTTVIVTGGTQTGGSANASNTDDTCGSESFDATLVPLDLYVMLDSSGSMLEGTGNLTKWDAVTAALKTFVNDPASSGIGLGLEFFPLVDPDVPATCHDDAECGKFAPCFQNYCAGAAGFYPCSTKADCVQDGQDYGPCSPLTFCWSQLTAQNPVPVLCHDDSECGRLNDCIAFSHCGTNETLLCDAPGRMCQDQNGRNAGTCTTAPPPSTCANWASCRTSSYAAPAVEIAALPGVARSITSAIAAQSPAGETPTAPALEGALQHASAWAAAHPDHKVAVVLATDGLPSECIADPAGDPQGIDEVSATAAKWLAATPSISTFVIGVFASTDTSSPGNLDHIAQAGGSKQAFIANTNDAEQQFLNALDTIRGAQLPCEFEIPAPTGGQPLSYDKVNVVFTTGGKDETLYYSGSAKACDPETGGWYYDVNPSDGTPHSIVACPASCSEFTAAADGHVSIQVGCTTLVR